MNLQSSEYEREAIYYSLSMRKNYITTGNVNYSVADIANMGMKQAVEMGLELVNLSPAQVQVVASLESLMARTMGAK